MKQSPKSPPSERLKFWYSQQLLADLGRINASSPSEYRYWDQEYSIACKMIQELEMELWDI